jgi:hypothetical protein
MGFTPIANALNGVPEKGHRFAFFLFLAYLLAGLWMAPDFGVPLDEQTQRAIGIVNNQFITRGSDGILEHRYYGPIFETTAFWLEQLIAPSGNSRQELLIRHYYLFLIVAFSGIAVYRSARLLYDSAAAGIGAGMLYLLHPRIFAESFYNSKDVLFMAVLSWAIYFFVCWMQYQRRKHLIGFAVASGIMASLRIQGLYFPVLAMLIWLATNKPALKHSWQSVLLAAAVSLVSLVAVYPYLWLNPPVHLWEVIRMARNFPWPWGTLTNGAYVLSRQTPWDYLPQWIAVTTPVLFLLTCASGLVYGLIRQRNPGFLLMAAAWLIPLVLAVMMRAPMYDGWRHYYFLWPATALSGAAIFTYLKSPKAQAAALVLLAFFPMRDIGRSHPHSMVYFNEYMHVTTPDLHQRWEMDYWGLGYRAALENLLERYPDTLKVYAWDQGIDLNCRILPEEKRKRIQSVPREEARFLIENLRGPKRQDYPGKIDFAVTPLGDTSLVVFRQY